MKKYTIQKDGFCGVLYPASDEKDKILITLSGSEGCIGHAKKLASWYEKNDIAALGYFKVPDAGKSLSRVPFEYIEAAIRTLKKAWYKNRHQRCIKRY